MCFMSDAEAVLGKLEKKKIRTRIATNIRRHAEITPERPIHHRFLDAPLFISCL